jgi:hypothetical protein
LRGETPRIPSKLANALRSLAMQADPSWVGPQAEIEDFGRYFGRYFGR